MITPAIISVVFAVVFWYIVLVPFNPTSILFWLYIFIVAVFTGIIFLLPMTKAKKDIRGFLKKWGIGIGVILLVVLLGIITSSKIFRAKDYSQMLQVETGSFKDDIKEISFDQIPTVDRDTAIRLGDRKMGEMVDLASQFNVSNAYTQIDYQDKAVRVTPLEYNGILKWMNNKKDGIPSYITVDMANGNTKLNKLDENIRYSKSDKFSRDITRHIRFKYPTTILASPSFEIDEEGKPYWITPTFKKKIGLFGGMDVDKVLVTDAVTGDIEEYKVEDVPSWIDRVYDANIIINQIDNWGSLKSGFFNSLFSQRGVLVSTEGYNYLAIDDDVFLYTGITSASRDSSNVGFILSNLRTKETKFYEMSSADEVSAMGSAEGEVQEKEYISTFPILLNIGDKPTYMMALKDNAELIKAYAFVDAKDYQNVSVGSTVEAALKKHGVSIHGEEDENKEVKEEKILVEAIESVVIDGNTFYYILSGDKVYRAKISVSNRLPFIEKNEEISISTYEKGDIWIIKSIK